MSRIIASRKIQDDYVQGICEHIKTPGYFSTLTFPRGFWTPSRDGKSKQYAESVVRVDPIKKAVGKLFALLNDHCAGKPTRPKNRDLRIAAIIESLKTRPHVHMITEDHRRLNETSLRDILLQASPNTSPEAIKVERIYDLEGLGRYLVKEINPDELVIRIELFGPLNKNGGSHA